MKKVLILIKISLKFVLKVPNNNIPALFQMIAWRRPGDKPLSEPMTFTLLMQNASTSELIGCTVGPFC